MKSLPSRSSSMRLKSRLVSFNVSGKSDAEILKHFGIKPCSVFLLRLQPFLINRLDVDSSMYSVSSSSPFGAGLDECWPYCKQFPVRQFTVHYGQEFWTEVAEHAYSQKMADCLNLDELYDKAISPHSFLDREGFRKHVGIYMKELERYFSQIPPKKSKRVKRKIIYGENNFVIVPDEISTKARRILRRRGQARVELHRLDLSKCQHFHDDWERTRERDTAETLLSMTSDSEFVQTPEPRVDNSSAPMEYDIQESVVPDHSENLPKTSAKSPTFYNSSPSDSTIRHDVLNPDETDEDTDATTLESPSHLETSDTTICDSPDDSAKEISETGAQERFVVLHDVCNGKSEINSDCESDRISNADTVIENGDDLQEMDGVDETQSSEEARSPSLIAQPIKSINGPLPLAMRN